MVIDGASMMTPVMLARIAFHLSLSLELNSPFGRLHILVIGDIFQFPTVSRGFAKPSLYQAAVLFSAPVDFVYRTKLIELEHSCSPNQATDIW